MMKKFLCIVFCTLLIVTVIPVASFPIQKENANTLQFTNELQKTPTPGYAPTPRHSPSVNIKKGTTHTYITINEINGVVIDMLEQTDPSIYFSYLENITDFGPRLTGSAACVEAAEYIYNEFQNMGLNVRYHSWINSGYSSNNVEATINGTNLSSDDIYIICAHYDTVSVSPGADDDGSGTAAVLAAAFVMSQYVFNYTIRFVAFSGEEQGLLGSEVYASQAAAQGWDIIGVLNADMISYAITQSDGNNLIVFENTASEWLYTFTNSVNIQYSDYIHLTLQHGGSTWGSDHNSFWDQGYDALFYFEYTETPYYHTSGDTLDHVNITYATKNTRLIVATLAELAQPRYPSEPPETPGAPDGPDIWFINLECNFSVVTTDPEEENVYYMFDWGDGTITDWFGPYPSGQTVEKSHTWTQLGDYEIKVKAKDIWGVISEWSEPAYLTIVEDQAPGKPVVSGKQLIIGGLKYNYTFVSADPESHDVYYKVDWADGHTTDWLGPYSSGESIILGHTWHAKGTFLIKAWSKDVFGKASSQSNYMVKVLFVIDPVPSENQMLYNLLKNLQQKSANL